MDTPGQFAPPPPSPPPLPKSGGGSFRAMAKFSWMSVLLSVVVNMALHAGSAGPHTKEGVMGRAIVAGFLMLAGIVCGIVALCGIPRHGAKGLLWPALTGLILWLGLTAIAVPNFLRARQLALQVRAAQAQRVNLTPAIHTPDAERLQDAELAFSFDLPSGYQKLPTANLPKRYRSAYIKPTPGETTSIIVISDLKPKLPTQHLTPADIQAAKDSSLTTFSWRGLAVDGVRVSEKSPDGEFITFNVHIPLKKRTVQIGFGGPAAKETAIRAIATQALSTLEGEPNWP